MSAAAAAPDYAAPFEAWRTWKVVRGAEGPLLSSLFFDLVWTPRTAVHASCLRRRWLDRLGVFRRDHVAPAPRCECGVYAAGLEQAVSYLWHPRVAPRRAPVHVLGRVLLWGDVIECERGYRASTAYPAELIVPTTVSGRGRLAGVEEVAAGLRRYGVPVRLLECQTREELVREARDLARVA
jgi:hypothetical protein